MIWTVQNFIGQCLWGKMSLKENLQAVFKSSMNIFTAVCPRLSVRLHARIDPAPTGRISLKFDFGCVYGNLSRNSTFG